jgi:hypothetical protein
MLRTYGGLKSLVALEGYLGPTLTTGSVRLYLDLDFRTYVEIPEDQIIYPDPSNAEQSAALTKDVNPTKIFIPASTKIEVVEVQSASIEASFLQGHVTSTHPVGMCGTPPAHHTTRTTCSRTPRPSCPCFDGCGEKPHETGCGATHPGGPPQPQEGCMKDKPQTPLHGHP